MASKEIPAQAADTATQASRAADTTTPATDIAAPAAPVPVHPASPEPHVEAAVQAQEQGAAASPGTTLKPPVAQSKTPAATAVTPTLAGRFRNLVQSIKQAPTRLYAALTHKEATVQGVKEVAKTTAPATAATTTTTTTTSPSAAAAAVEQGKAQEGMQGSSTAAEVAEKPARTEGEPEVLLKHAQQMQELEERSAAAPAVATSDVVKV